VRHRDERMIRPDREQRGRSVAWRIAVTGVVVAMAGAVSGTAAASPGGGSAAPRPRILGGSNDFTADAPWTVALTDDEGRNYCGGTLVSPIKVVTAAHCTVDSGTTRTRSPESLRAVVGRTDLRTGEGTVGLVDRVWVHPEYGGYAHGEDIAVLTLRAPVPQQPLPLVGADETGSYQPGAKGRIYGWGRTRESGPSSPVLRSAEVPVVGDSDCGKAYPEYTNAEMFCAGVLEGGPDACVGDSGGPFVVKGRLAGVVSFGTGCGRPNQPGVYTRVSRYANEIAAQM
jgi:secreted trypsin-like serine protease